VFAGPDHPNAAVITRSDVVTSELQRLGFEHLEQSSELVGNIGCGRYAEDRQSFRRVAPDQWGIDARVVVHVFTCGDVWRAVIVSGRSGDRAAAEVNQDLASALAPEIAAGVVRMNTQLWFTFE
jgi:hypothetical protein